LALQYTARVKTTLLTFNNVTNQITCYKLFLFFSERYEKEHSTVLAVFEEAMAVGFSTPASYLEVPEVSKMPLLRN
jgi:hypothetical protein